MKRYALMLVAAGLAFTGCKESVKTASEEFNELPPAVQKTARAQAPNAEIADVDHTARNGSDVYEIQFRGNGDNPKVVIMPDGTLLSSDLPKTAGPLTRALTPTGAAGTPLSALPLEVQRTIQAHAPQVQIKDVTRQEVNGRVIYRVEFVDDGKNPSIRVAEDGALVQTLQK